VISAASVAIYLASALVVFDFGSVAVPYDEDNFGNQQVAIGPQPRSWVPRAVHGYDMPGGFDYAPEGWPFIVWKPLCIVFVRAKGYALPAEWR